ncbi:transcriptional regulator [Paenibacillus ihbetae]|uniref:Transcriptional regulator n=1 Tax=Paenibacillus ihbetae TaxID=1870820 RepID=A0A1B2E6R6_9BACL|nr:helix-turn-helix transcriptional regulator [Paenibacillus ihbetae]ANY75651.1 transcriptional regulator [Paenibacillus ihbetae]
MKTTATIRSEIDKFLHHHRLTINQFARLSGVNSGTLSSILNGHRPMSMQQLDRITHCMGLEDGHFYDMYIDEFIFHLTPDWRRLGPLLQRCAQLDKLDSLDKAARIILDNVSYAPMLFELAESFYYSGRNEASMLLYECVAESEKSQHSERLALCQYRIFTLKLSDDQEKNLQAAVQFEPYIDKLDERYQLDAYKNLLNTYSALHRWEDAERLSRRMRQAAKMLYTENRNAYQVLDYPNKPVIFYILYSYLMESHTYKERGKFDKALELISYYQDPDWVDNPSQEELVITDQFSEWAKANRYLYRLLSGQPDSLDMYVEFISSNEDEIFHALTHIMVAANRYHLQVDHILERYKDYIAYKPRKSRIGTIDEQVNINNYTRLLAELGIYYLNAKRYEEGLAYIVDSLEYSIRIRSDKGMLRCMGLFEQFRPFASPEIQQRYQNLISEVQKLSVYAWLPMI